MSTGQPLPPVDASWVSRVCLTGYFLLGATVVVFPPLMPSVIAEFGLTLSSVALIFPASALGGLAGGLLAGLAADRGGRKALVCAAAALYSLAFCAASLAGGWPTALAAFLLAGIAQGATSTLLNAVISDANRSRRGRALNFLHGTYGIGALLAPLAIAWFLAGPGTWRIVLQGIGALWLTFAVIFGLVRSPQAPAGRERRRAHPHLALLRDPLFASFFAIAFIYNGVAWSLLGWVKLFIEQTSSLTGWLSTGMISLFYAGLTIGRFACGHLSESLGYPRTILVLASGTAIAYPLVIISGQPLLTALGVAVAGLFLSGLYPTALAAAAKHHPDLAGTVTGTLSVGMTLGTMLPPWWTGIVADRWGFAAAMGLNGGLVLLLLWIAVRLARAGAGRATPATARR